MLRNFILSNFKVSYSFQIAGQKKVSYSFQIFDTAEF